MVDPKATPSWTHPICCLNCRYTTHDESIFMEHVKIHQFEKNRFRIPCTSFSCPKSFNSFKTFKQHKKKCKLKKHQEAQSKDEDKLPTDSNDGHVWSCPNCNDVLEIHKSPNLDDFEKIKTHCEMHAKNEEVACPIHECGSRYKVRSLKRKVYRNEVLL